MSGSGLLGKEKAVLSGAAFFLIRPTWSVWLI